MLPVSELTVFAGGAAHQTSHAEAMRAGVEASGVKAKIARSSGGIRTKHVACWGWHHGRMLRQRGHEVLVMERGYVGDRFAWTSLGWNGLNGRAKFARSDDASRFAQHFASLLKPWKDGGDYVLLVGQVPGDASLGGMDLGSWYDESAKAAGREYGLPVRFRPHPQALVRGYRRAVPGTSVSKGTLAEDLAGAAVVVAFNSNTTVESVLAGVPTVACDSGSMAYEVCAHTIGAIFKPDRTAWAARLAWCQWTMDEIRSGKAWQAVRPR